MDFYCTTAFLSTFNIYTKKPKKELYSCKRDIPELFSKENLEKEEWDWAIWMRGGDNYVLYKIRAPNSAKKVGKSQGFRLHFAFDKNNEVIIFFGLLSKTEKEKFPNKEYQSLVKTLINENDSSELTPLEINSGSIEVLDSNSSSAEC